MDGQRDQLEHNQHPQSVPQFSPCLSSEEKETSHIIGQESSIPLEKIHEYEKTGNKFKLNGYWYFFSKLLKSKNKYFTCIKRCNSEKCHGSIVITPNRQIAKKVDHSCNKASQECSTMVDKEVYRRCSVVLVDLKSFDEMNEYDERGRKLKINCLDELDIKASKGLPQKQYQFDRNQQRCSKSLLGSTHKLKVTFFYLKLFSQFFNERLFK